MGLQHAIDFHERFDAIVTYARFWQICQRFVSVVTYLKIDKKNVF